MLFALFTENMTNIVRKSCFAVHLVLYHIFGFVILEETTFEISTALSPH